MLWTVILLCLLIFIYKCFFRKNCLLSCEGKSVLITGCDSGIGLSLALYASQLGFHVIATCLNESSHGAQLLREKCSRILIRPMDVTQLQDIIKVRQDVEEYLVDNQISLWAVVNNAAVLIFGHLDWQTHMQIFKQIDVNLLGVCRVMKVFLPLLRRSKGRIINVTSSNGFWPLPGLAVYSAAKHGLEGLSCALRAELKPWDVHVILLNPGNFPENTQILAHQHLHAQEMKENMLLEDWSYYGDYFECFQNHLQKDVKPKSHVLDDPGLKKAFMSAVLEKSPSYYYNNLSVGFNFFIMICQLLPVKIRDNLYLKLIGKQVGWDWSRRTSC